MARVFRHQYTKKARDGTRVTKKARKWYIEYRDAQGVRRRVPGYTDKRATEQKAAELERKAERQRAGIIDQADLDFSEHAVALIDRHVDAYRAHLAAAGVSEKHLRETTRRVRLILEACNFRRFKDIRAEPVNNWCNLRTDEGMSSRTRNTYVGSLRAFIRWAIKDGRIDRDPLERLVKADEKRDKRRIRRALTEDELSQLLIVAKDRPLLDARMIRRGPRKGQLAGKLRPIVRKKLERLGRERKLIYMTLVLTGLRRGELEKITWSDLNLDGSEAWLTVRAKLAKSRREDVIPIRKDHTTRLIQ